MSIDTHTHHLLASGERERRSTPEGSIEEGSTSYRSHMHTTSIVDVPTQKIKMSAIGSQGKLQASVGSGKVHAHVGFPKPLVNAVYVTLYCRTVHLP